MVQSKNTPSPSSPKVGGLTRINRRHLHRKWWRSVKKLAGKGQNTSFYNVFSPFTTLFSCSTKNYDQMCIVSDRPCYSASINLVLCPTSAYSRISVEKKDPKTRFLVFWAGFLIVTLEIFRVMESRLYPRIVLCILHQIRVVSCAN